MDYEKKYNEALERAKEIKSKIFSSHLSTESCKAVSEYIDEIIPELAESEDERIRKQLINICNEWLGGGYSARPCLNDVRWLKNLLEKQKEQKPANNYLEWRNIVYYVLKEWLGIGQYMDMAPFNDIVKTLQERYSFPKSAEWSEEDKAIYDAIICEVVNEGMCPTPAQANWLKILPEKFNLKSKQEWSEEDENGMFSDIIMAIRAFYKCGREDLVDYVKSLRPSWKPSEEQMEAFESAMKLYKDTHFEIHHKKIVSLYEQLKKLM